MTFEFKFNTLYPLQPDAYPRNTQGSALGVNLFLSLSSVET